ncbi:hypothetical protein [Dysgonomonas sp. GY617]|uniref:hypothetical protein n=1 Tax=Dysgonomonas sp. GY617 TaxID=2780420 RepID=UPI0018839C4B|nr:hypothetical protein [Dysgonomonas sp. GY617]MBF0575512.1 hypothetical protein [Dysgonomonas sp. GY617]
MKNILWIFLVFLFAVFYSCDNEEPASAPDKTKELINTAKFDYQTKFKHLKHFNDYLSTPVWDSYEMQEDSINQYVYVPFQRVVEYENVISYLIIVSNKENQKRSYYIKIKDESVQLQTKSTENKTYNLYEASLGNKAISQGYIENNQFIKTNEISFLSLENPLQLKSGFYDSPACGCHNGGTIGEVVVTAPGGSGGNWWDIPTFPGGGSPGIGGGGSSTSPSANLSKIASKTSLDSEGIKELNKILQELLEQCGFKALFDYLANNGKRFGNVKIDPSIDVGGYDYITNELLFNNNSAIYGAFPEEFIHLFQQNFYPGGLAPYSNVGRINIEFEAKLMQDILCYINAGACPQYGSGKNYSAQYLNWVIEITKDGTYIPKYSDLLNKNTQWGNLNYWDFLRDFQADPNRQNYNFPINESLQPKALNYLNQSNCNN